MSVCGLVSRVQPVCSVPGRLAALLLLTGPAQVAWERIARIRTANGLGPGSVGPRAG